MKRAAIFLLGAAAGLLGGVTLAEAADISRIERLATCQDSWYEWRTNDPLRLRGFVEDIERNFVRHGNDAFFVPQMPLSVLGLSLSRLYPGNVGMGVGFSVLVEADFTTTKARLEQKIGKPLGKCESGENMRTCELPIAEKKTVTLLSEDNPKAKTTLFGCYYFYEK